MNRSWARLACAALSLLAGAGATACGLSGTGTGSPDAGADGDAGTSDGAASSSADAATDSGPSRFCATVSPTPTFCADFDDPGAVDAGTSWDKMLTGPGAVALDSTRSLSPPRSLHATTSQNKPAGVAKTITASSRLTVELDVLFPALPTAASGEQLAPVSLAPTDGSAVTLFYSNVGASYFQQGGDDYSTHTPTGLSLGQWHHLVLTIKGGVGLASTCDASVDGAPLWTAHTLKHAWAWPLVVDVQVGLPYLWRAQTGDASVDNVVIRAQ